MHQIAGAGHYELDIIHNIEDFLGGMEEVFRTFLHRNAAQEKHNLLIFFDDGFIHGPFPVALDAVINDFNFIAADTVSAHDNIAGKMAHGNDFVGPVHAFSFDVINHLVYMLAAAVEFCRMHVHNQRSSTYSRHGNSRRIGHPVMGVDNIKLLIFS